MPRSQVIKPIYAGNRAPGAAGPGASGGAVRQTSEQFVAPPIVITSGVIPHVFGFTSLGANVSDLKGSRGPGQIGVQQPFAGSVVALAFRALALKSAGTASFQVFAEGGATGQTIDWTTGVLKATQAWPEGTFPFATGEELDIRATTVGFAPAANVEVLMYVTYEPS